MNVVEKVWNSDKKMEGRNEGRKRGRKSERKKERKGKDNKRDRTRGNVSSRATPPLRRSFPAERITLSILLDSARTVVAVQMQEDKSALLATITVAASLLVLKSNCGRPRLYAPSYPYI